MSGSRPEGEASRARELLSGVLSVLVGAAFAVPLLLQAKEGFGGEKAAVIALKVAFFAAGAYLLARGVSYIFGKKWRLRDISAELVVLYAFVALVLVAVIDVGKHAGPVFVITFTVSTLMFSVNYYRSARRRGTVLCSHCGHVSRLADIRVERERPVCPWCGEDVSATRRRGLGRGWHGVDSEHAVEKVLGMLRKPRAK